MTKNLKVVVRHHYVQFNYCLGVEFRAPNFFNAFTLIEILTVVAIIGILATMSLGSLAAVGQRNRDGRRKTDLNLISQAIDLYYSETRTLPKDRLGGCTQKVTSIDTVNEASWIPGLAADYIPSAQTLPRDPFYPRRTDYFYTYQCVSEWSLTYALSATLENQRDRDARDGIYTITR